MTEQKQQLKEWVIQNMIDIEADNLDEEKRKMFLDLVSERKDDEFMQECFAEFEKRKEEEFCYDHEQKMWGKCKVDGKMTWLKCGGCLEEEEPTITYETFDSQYDNDKVMLFKYDGDKYDYSDELYWDKDNYKYEWINLVIKEYNLEFGDRWCFDYKHQTDNAFMFWRKHSKRPIIHCDFKICSKGNLWKAKRDVKDVEGKLKVIVSMIKVKSNLFEEEEEEEKPKIQWCGRCRSSHEMPRCEFIALPRSEGGHIPDMLCWCDQCEHRTNISSGGKCFFCKKKEEEE